MQTVCSTPASYAHPSRILFANRVVVLSQHTMRCFLDAGVEASRLVLIPPGICIPPRPTQEARLLARTRYGLPPEGPVIIYPGDLQFSDAARTLARAIPLLDDLAASYVIACRIKQPVSLKHQRSLRILLAERGVLARVRFFSDVSDMIQLLSACDLCVLPAESLFAKMDLPLVLIEAMALGIPILVADRPPLTELLHQGGGVAIPPRDPEALAHEIRRLIEAPSHLEQMGDQARATVSQNYNITNISKQYEDLYEDLLL